MCCGCLTEGGACECLLGGVGSGCDVLLAGTVVSHAVAEGYPSYWIDNSLVSVTGASCSSIVPVGIQNGLANEITGTNWRQLLQYGSHSQWFIGLINATTN